MAIIPAIDLVHWKRFDVMAKYLYAKHRRAGIDVDWARDLYLEHLRVFNGFNEIEPRKRGQRQFLETFDSILDSIGEQGYDPDTAPVPVGRDGAILNGAHRVAACLAYGRPVHCIRESRPGYDFSAGWFRKWKMFCKEGLSAAVADPMALEYCRLSSKCRSFMLDTKTQAGVLPILEPLIRQYGSIVYARRTAFGLFMLLELDLEMESVATHAINRVALESGRMSAFAGMMGYTETLEWAEKVLAPNAMRSRTDTGALQPRSRSQASGLV